MTAPGLNALLAESAAVVREHGAAALCQIVRAKGSTPGKVGWKMLLGPDGSSAGNLGGGSFEALVQADARGMLERRERRPAVKRYYLTDKAVRGEPTGMVCGGLIEVLIEVLTRTPVLVICGGGPVGQALASAADLCGFELLVAEDREEFRQPDLFPAGTVFAPVDRDYNGDFLQPFERRELLVAVVTRCWETDLAALASVLRQAPPQLGYLGLMGSERKVDRVRQGLAEGGLSLAKLPFYAPIGLPIGAEEPAEIAVSILAEIVGVRSGAARTARPAVEYARQSG